MPPTVETTLIGAGVIGCALAWELASAGREVLVLEKNPGVTQGENQSSRNSGVIHAGLYYDRETRPLKARLCAQGNALLRAFCEHHGVPHRACGKLVVASREEDLPVLALYRERAVENAVPVAWLTHEQVRDLEPQVTTLGALHLPTSGIVDPTALVYRLHTLAVNQGAIFLTGTSLTGAASGPEGIALTIAYRDGTKDTFLSRSVINCAGLYADEAARLMDPGSPHVIDPVRGEAAKFYRTRRPDLHLRGMNVYPTPTRVHTNLGTYFTVGVHLTPTLEPGPSGDPSVGPTVTVGPLNGPARHREDYGGDGRGMAAFHDQVSPFFPSLRVEDLEPHQVGIQARLAGHQDWLFEFSSETRAWMNLLGIDSPGLTACLAIAEHVRGLLESSL